MIKTQQRSGMLISLIGLTVLLISITGCANQNKDFLNAFTENFWNEHNLAAFEEYYSADLIVHAADGDYNFEQWKEVCQAYFTGFPDLHITTDDLIAEGDKAVKVWTANSTHKGDFMGIPATGNRIMIKGIEVFRIADGKIAEIWMSMDMLGMMQQLGVIPPMGE